MRRWICADDVLEPDTGRAAPDEGAITWRAAEDVAPGGTDGLGAATSQLTCARISYCDELADAMVGILVVADAASEGDGRGTLRAAFRLDAHALEIAGDDRTARLLDQIAAERQLVTCPADALCQLVAIAVRDHPAALQRQRERLEGAEERILDGRSVNRRRLIAARRRALALGSIYADLSDAAEALAHASAGIVPEASAARFARLSRALDRLERTLDELQSYSLELASLYQEGIDVRQNSVMQWLTVVATIFMPLTFITSWYGMNFDNMVLIGEPWGYAAAGALCIAIAVAEVIWFHRRGWLHFGHRDHPGRHGARRDRR